MRYIKIMLFLVVSMSFLFPHHGKRKAWKHKKRHQIREIHKKPKINISLGYNHIWSTWRWNYWRRQHKNRDVVIVQNTKNSDKNENYSVDEIISQIEKLAILKEKGIISEKDYEKKKKELLKRI